MSHLPKRRAIALLILCGWIALVSWIAYIYVTQPSTRPRPPNHRATPISQGLQDELMRVSRAWDILHALRTEETENRRHLAASRKVLPADAPPAPPTADTPAQQAQQLARQRKYMVSMIIKDGRGGGAIVDGIYLREGEQHASGILLRKVHDHGIELVDSLGLVHDLPLKNAYTDPGSHHVLGAMPPPAALPLP